LNEKELKGAEFVLRQHLDERNLSNEISLSTKITSTSITGRVRFDCLLKDRQTILSTSAVFSGIFEQSQEGPTAGCVDGDYFEDVTFQSINISLTGTRLDVPLFKILGEIVPAGGAFIVSYAPASEESRSHKETKQALERDYPPVVTPLGYLLFIADCGIDLKDKRSTEGQRQSGKIQGFRAVNAEERKKKGLSLIRELHHFLGTRSEDDGLARACRTRAFAAIEMLHAISG
jgi:hypothetical protein